MLARQISLRCVLGVGTVLLVSLLVFFATNVLPGDAARAILGRSATPEAVAALRAQMGLDQPIPVQYLSWLSGIVHGNLGTSLVSKEPVWASVAGRLQHSLLLLAIASLVAISLSFLVGILMAIRPGAAFDNIMGGTLIIAAGIPEFIFAIILVVLLSTHVLHLLPPTAIIPAGDTLQQHLVVLILPVMTLTLAILPYLSRLVRNALIEALASEYVVTARLKGLPPRLVLLRHALLNSLIPFIQGIASTLAYILGGAVVVEVVFQYPGLGFGLQQAVGQRDVPTVQAIVLIFAAGYVVFNILADVVTIVVTPRLRT
jgi:peptide/nickel transport system permease protein